MSYDLDDDFGPTLDGHPPTRGGAGDLAASIGLLVVALLVGATLSFAVLIEQMKVAACSVDLTGCDFTLIGISTWLVPAATAATLTASWIALAHRRRTGAYTWWVPLLGFVGEVIAFAIASSLIDVAIPR
ncbi:hypothetical protein [Leifsonia sp. RAF41]|uniref:hypothetical protein n=1 Tax=Leifsonia sp. RAF41 TaxID=3233056 RepID=UPI003F9BB2CD